MTIPWLLAWLAAGLFAHDLPEVNLTAEGWNNWTLLLVMCLVADIKGSGKV